MSRLAQLWRGLLVDYRRPLQGLGAVLLLAIVVDFVVRVHVPRDASLREFKAPASMRVPDAVPAATVAAALEAWLPSAAVTGPPKEREIALQGIFRAPAGAIAVVTLRDPGGGAVETLRTTEGQTVEGWTVEEISARKVTLRKGEQTRDLLLFRPPAE